MNAGADVVERELTAAIRDYFEPERSGLTMMAARKFGVPERTVVEALVGHWPIVRLRAEGFRELIESFAALGPMRVFVRSRAAILEAVGTFGGFSETGPFFNVQTDTLDMHLIPAEVGSIYAVDKIGHDSTITTHSFQFFDRSGDAAFKAFLWDGFPEVPAERVANYRELIERFADHPERAG